MLRCWGVELLSCWAVEPFLAVATKAAVYLGVLAMAVLSVSLFSEENKPIFGPDYPRFVAMRSAQELLVGVHLWVCPGAGVKLLLAGLSISMTVCVSKWFVFFERRRTRVEVVARLVEGLAGVEALTGGGVEALRGWAVCLPLLVLAALLSELSSQAPRKIFGYGTLSVREGFRRILEFGDWARGTKTAGCARLYEFQRGGQQG